MNRKLVLGVLLLASVAMVLRWPNLSQRPFHNDEAVNAVKFVSLWDDGEYRYDPNEHHGPSLYYATLAWARLTGAPSASARFSEGTLRGVVVAFGVAIILVLPLLWDALGRRGTLWAALFLAVSPAMVFYSRYYIHEILLIFATVLAIGSGWRYWKDRKVGWAILCGVGLGLMQGTKETFVLTFAAAGLAIFLNQFWNRMLDASAEPVRAPRLSYLHLVAAVVAWLLVFTVLFTSFFTNFQGLADAIKTYLPWVQRAGGDSPHIQPWYFYFHRLLWFHPGKGPVWTELLILVLAGVGAAGGFLRKGMGKANPSFVRFLALTTFLLAAFYSLIPYKTPWCLLNFWVGALLLAGIGATTLVNRVQHQWVRATVALALVLGAGHLGWQSWQLDHRYATDRRNPHVYAHTSGDFRRLIEKVQAVADASADTSQLVIKVVAPESDYWPMPWYLRSFQKVGYWDKLPEDPFAPIMLVSARLHAALDDKETHLMIGYFELRPEVFLEFYVEKSLWEAYLKSHPPPPLEE